MKKFSKLTFALLVVALGFPRLFEYFRESELLENSNLNLKRSSVVLFYREEKSINFGADSRQTVAFHLPSDYKGTEQCGTNGYSSLNNVNIPELGLTNVEGCSFSHQNNSGVVYNFTLLNHIIFIKTF